MGMKCLAQGHTAVSQVRIEPDTLRSSPTLSQLSYRWSLDSNWCSANPRTRNAHLNDNRFWSFRTQRVSYPGYFVPFWSFHTHFSVISDQGVPGSNTGRCTFRCGLEQVTFTLLSTGWTQYAVDGRPTWTDCDEAGDYVVPNVLSPRDLVFRPDNMDETVPHFFRHFVPGFNQFVPEQFVPTLIISYKVQLVT